jgi:hypothetical protein
MAIESDQAERSYAAIESRDLVRLSQLARDDLERYMARDPSRRRNFAAKKLCVALCQGAAQHFLGKPSGIKDFDIFTFFAVVEGMEFPSRRRATVDFGPSKFGRNPGDAGFGGRRVDLMGRSIVHCDGAPEIFSLQKYLRSAPTRTAWFLAQKAVVVIDPAEFRGQVIWPESEAVCTEAAERPPSVL